VDALLWAILLTAIAALGVLALVNRDRAEAALNVALAAWVAITLFALPLLLVRS
jgi:hypothetical protein